MRCIDYSHSKDNYFSYRVNSGIKALATGSTFHGVLFGESWNTNIYKSSKVDEAYITSKNLGKLSIFHTKQSRDLPLSYEFEGNEISDAAAMRRAFTKVLKQA